MYHCHVWPSGQQILRGAELGALCVILVASGSHRMSGAVLRIATDTGWGLFFWGGGEGGGEGGGLWAVWLEVTDALAIVSDF